MFMIIMVGFNASFLDIIATVYCKSTKAINTRLVVFWFSFQFLTSWTERP